ncbi:unnamed protein product [Caenorhabditis bovis]|uniref:Peptidase A2 domain-containing protein n=1 Tax=Caenorhabditis bovis TaxID=2654633 RepID=A0A8S1F0R4_9PELO|nr:unnamed protein product [Caenorhabditis bovis]
MGDNKDTAMLQMMKLLQEQMELTRIQAEEGRKQTAKFAELVERLSGNAQRSTKLEKVEVSEASIIASLAERIPTFDFNLEDNRTFPKWYNRYAEMLKGLSEDGKRQLLLEKLSEPCYEQLVAALRPKRCIELSVEELTETLSNIFDIKRSLFAYRFACLQISKAEETPTEYANRVNEMCEKARLEELSAEDWKVFFFIKGLDRPADEKMRTHFLHFMERRTTEQKQTTIKDLFAEWMRILSLKKDSEEIERRSMAEVETSEQSRQIGAGVGNKERYRRPGNAGTVVKQGISRRNVVNPLQNPKGRLASVKGQWIDFQVDTGADITLIGRVEWEKLGKPTLETADAKVICANGSTMEIDGRFHTDFELKGSTGQGWIYVRKEGNLLGLDFINQSEHMAYHMERMEELGTCVKEKAHLEVKEGDEDIVIAEVKVLNVDYLAEGEATATDKVLKTVIKYWKSNNWPRRNPVNDLCTNQSSSSSDNDNTHSPPDKPKSNEHPNQKSCHGQSQPSSSKHRHSQIPVAIAKESAGSTRTKGSQRTVCVKPKIEPNTQAGPEDRAKDKSVYDAVQEFGNPSYDLIPVHNEDPTYISQQP